MEIKYGYYPKTRIDYISQWYTSDKYTTLIQYWFDKPPDDGQTVAVWRVKWK